MPSDKLTFEPRSHTDLAACSPKIIRPLWNRPPKSLDYNCWDTQYLKFSPSFPPPGLTSLMLDNQAETLVDKSRDHLITCRITYSYTIARQTIYARYARINEIVPSHRVHLVHRPALTSSFQLETIFDATLIGHRSNDVITARSMIHLPGEEKITDHPLSLGTLCTIRIGLLPGSLKSLIKICSLCKRVTGWTAL